MLAVGLLVFALTMVLMFEATNGFHDAANAVATVIYTKSLKPTEAVVWSGIMNFIGVLVGGIAVAYALVELLPAQVLSPPDGGPAVAMLIALLASALFWNILPGGSRCPTRARIASLAHSSASPWVTLWRTRMVWLRESTGTN